MKYLRLVLISGFLVGSCSFGARAGFSTGTDENGTYYFPQTMAEWCSLNYDADISEQTIKECFEKIAGEYYNRREPVAREAKKRFRKMKMEAVIHAFKTALDAKKAFANEKAEDATEKINTDAADSERTMASGNAETNRKLMEQENWIDALRGCLAEIDNLNTMENNGEVFVKEDEVAE